MHIAYVQFKIDSYNPSQTKEVNEIILKKNDYLQNPN